MSISPRFCSRCGAPLGAGARFCEACGKPVDVAAVSPIEATQLSSPPPPPAARSGSQNWTLILIGCGAGIVILALACVIFWGLAWVGSSSRAAETGVAQVTAAAQTQTVIASSNATIAAANAQANATANAQATQVAQAQASATANAQATQTAQAQTTATAIAQATQTAQAQASATANAQVTQTAQAQTTATAIAQATQTAQAQATAAANAQATQTAQAQANATANAQATTAASVNATATAQAAIALVNNVLWQRAGQPVGVPDGRIDCSQSGAVGASTYAAVSPRNFFAEAQFFNSTDLSTHAWDYGFSFRRTGPVNQYRLVVSSDKQWRLANTLGTTAADGTADTKDVAKGTLTNLDVSKDGTNLIGLVVNDQVAYFFLNGIFIATLDVSDRNTAGNIYAGSGFTTGFNFPGCSTPYKNFVVRPLP